MSDHPILFIPGPVEVESELREIMSTPVVGHRAPEFRETVKRICDKLQGLFLGAGPAYFENCSATAMMEAGVRNLVHDRILHLTCGAFGERWAQISEACGRSAEHLSVDWGKAIRPEALRDILTNSEPFEAVCITHSETSTGVLNPLKELAEVIREVSPDTLILVDAVSSLGAAELRFADWGLDLVFAGIQKALALPPGLTVYAISERAQQKASSVPGRGFLLDFSAVPKRYAAGATSATPCVPLVFALEAQLDRIQAEGLENRWARHIEMQQATISWGEQHGMSTFAEDGYRSPAVTALEFGDHDADRILASVKEAGFFLSKGYGRIKDETFRIGHMGDHPLDRVHRLLEAIERGI